MSVGSVVDAFGILLHRSGLLYFIYVYTCRTVENRYFGGVNLYEGVIHAATPQGGHKVLYGRDACLSGGYGSAARGVYYVLRQRFDAWRAIHVGTREDYAVACFGRFYGHDYIHAGVQAFACNRYIFSECSL